MNGRKIEWMEEGREERRLELNKEGSKEGNKEGGKPVSHSHSTILSYVAHLT